MKTGIVFRSGITFAFNYMTDLELPELVMDRLVPKHFWQGKVEVLLGEESLGIAGRMTTEQIAAIPKKSDLSLVTDIDDIQLYEDFLAGVSDMNRTLQPKGRGSSPANAFSIYCGNSKSGQKSDQSGQFHYL